MGASLRNLKVVEGSIVDRGANPGARIVLTKRENAMPAAAPVHKNPATPAPGAPAATAPAAPAAAAPAAPAAPQLAAGDPMATLSPEQKTAVEAALAAKDQEIARLQQAAGSAAGAAAASAGKANDGPPAAEPDGDESPAMKALQKRLNDERAEMQKRLAEVQKVADAEREARLTREYVDKAADYHGLPVSKAELGKALREIDEKLSPEVAKQLHRVLKAASAAGAAGVGVLSKRIGAGDAGAGGGGSAHDQLLAKAGEIQKASTGKLTREMAYAKAMEEHPDLYLEAEREQREAARSAAR